MGKRIRRIERIPIHFTNTIGAQQYLRRVITNAYVNLHSRHSYRALHRYIRMMSYCS